MLNNTIHVKSQVHTRSPSPRLLHFLRRCPLAQTQSQLYRGGGGTLVLPVVPESHSIPLRSLVFRPKSYTRNGPQSFHANWSYCFVPDTAYIVI